jgi:hypothetical protein
MHRKHDHRRMRSQTGDLSRGLDTVHDRHLKVQDHDVRMQFFYFLYRDPAVLGLAAYSPFAAALEAETEQTPDHCVSSTIKME